MGQVGRTRRRLPRRVYWVRRGIVLLVAAALVVGIAQLIGGIGSDGAPAATSSDQANTVASTPRAATSAAAPVGPVAPSKALAKNLKATQVLTDPTGPCRDDEVSAMPAVDKAAAGGPITIALRMQGTQPACTFEVSPDTVVAKITSGKDRIWSSQDCPKAIPSTSVVVRSGTPVQVPIAWSGRRSDQDCSTRTSWAMPGFYHVYAAAMGSTPSDVQFEVTLPDRPVVTKTAKPRPRKTASPSPTPSTPSRSSTVKGKQTKCGGDIAAGSC